MAVQPITKHDFDLHGIRREPDLLGRMPDEREWFANNENSLIGVIAFDHSDKNFTCGIYETPGADLAHVPGGFETIEEARSYIKEKMEMTADELNSL